MNNATFEWMKLGFGFGLGLGIAVLATVIILYVLWESRKKAKFVEDVKAVKTLVDKMMEKKPAFQTGGKIEEQDSLWPFMQGSAGSPKPKNADLLEVTAKDPDPTIAFPPDKLGPKRRSEDHPSPM